MMLKSSRQDSAHLKAVALSGVQVDKRDFRCVRPPGDPVRQTQLQDRPPLSAPSMRHARPLLLDTRADAQSLTPLATQTDQPHAHTRTHTDTDTDTDSSTHQHQTHRMTPCPHILNPELAGALSHLERKLGLVGGGLEGELEDFAVVG